MAFRRRKTFRRKRATRKKFLKKRSYRKGMPTTGRMGTVFPDKMKCVLTYSKQYDFNGSTSPAAQVWRINSLYDPDLTGAGAQPMPFDQLSLFYQKYRVHGVKITADIINDSLVSIKGVLATSDTDSSSSSVQLASEYKYSLPFTVGPIGAVNKKRVSKYISIKKIHGYSNIEQVDYLSSAVSANPADVVLSWIRIHSLDDATVTKAYALVKIKFYSVMFDTVNPAES